jgi:hypothetical protein
MNPVIQLQRVTTAVLSAVILTFTSVAEARSQPDLGGCTTSVEQGTLFVIGNEIANIIEIIGSEGGVQVTCDGSSNTFDRIDTIKVEVGDGDDQISTDDSNGLLGGIAINIFGEGGDDGVILILPLELLEPLEIVGLSFVGDDIATGVGFTLEWHDPFISAEGLEIYGACFFENYLANPQSKLLRLTKSA